MPVPVLIGFLPQPDRLTASLPVVLLFPRVPFQGAPPEAEVLIEELKMKLAEQYRTIRHAFRTIDCDKSGSLSIEEFKRVDSS